MGIDFDSKPTYGYDNKYIITKVKIHTASVITKFQNKKIPKEKVLCKCLSITMLDYVIGTNEKYYLQTFLEQCKYAQEKIKFENILMKNQIVTLMIKKSKIDADNDNDSDDKSFIESILTQ